MSLSISILHSYVYCEKDALCDLFRSRYPSSKPGILGIPSKDESVKATMETNSSSSGVRQQRRIAFTDLNPDQGIPADASTRRSTRGLPVRIPTGTPSNRTIREPTRAPPLRLLTFGRHGRGPHTQRARSGMELSAADGGVSRTLTGEASPLPNVEPRQRTGEPTSALRHHENDNFKPSLTAAVDSLLGLLPLIGPNAPTLLGYLIELPLYTGIRAIAKHFGHTTIFDIGSNFDLSLLLEMKERALFTKEPVGNRLHRCTRSNTVLQPDVAQDFFQVHGQNAFASGVWHQRSIRLQGTYFRGLFFLSRLFNRVSGHRSDDIQKPVS